MICCLKKCQCTITIDWDIADEIMQKECNLLLIGRLARAVTRTCRLPARFVYYVCIMFSSCSLTIWNKWSLRPELVFSMKIPGSRNGSVVWRIVSYYKMTSTRLSTGHAGTIWSFVSKSLSCLITFILRTVFCLSYRSTMKPYAIKCPVKFVLTL